MSNYVRRGRYLVPRSKRQVNMKKPGVVRFGCNLNAAMHAPEPKIDTAANLIAELEQQKRARESS